jgi:hypothetical protein
MHAVHASLALGVSLHLSLLVLVLMLVLLLQLLLLLMSGAGSHNPRQWALNQYSCFDDILHGPCSVPI